MYLINRQVWYHESRTIFFICMPANPVKFLGNKNYFDSQHGEIFLANIIEITFAWLIWAAVFSFGKSSMALHHVPVLLSAFMLSQVHLRGNLQ